MKKQQQESSKTESDKWGVLAALEIEILTDADLFSWLLLSNHTCDQENRLIMTCKTQTEDQKTPSPTTKKYPFIRNFLVNETEKRKG